MKQPVPTENVAVQRPVLPPGYVLERELTRGSRTWTCLASGPRGRVVLRVAANSPAETERLQELAVLSVLRHPGLAALVDHGTLPGGATFVARTWIDGVDLATHARQLAAVGEARGRTLGAIVARLASALGHVHRAGFVHADLKAENAIVEAADGTEGRVVLTDFGLSRALTDIQSGPSPSGSLFALAPEVLLGSAPSAASDLFALGMLLARLLVPDHARAAEFYARFPAEDALAALGIAPESLPEWSRDLVAGLLERDPSARPQSAEWVAATLFARLGLQREAAGSKRPALTLKVPVRLGRGRFLEERFAALLALRPGAPSAVEWWTLPYGEEARDLVEDARLLAALQGIPGTTLEVEAVEHEDLAAIDQFARAFVLSSAGTVAWCAVPASSNGRRIVEHVVRTSQQESQRDRPAPIAIIVAAPAAVHSAPPDDRSPWRVHAVPAVSLEDLRAFLEREIEEPVPARTSALAELVHSGTGGAVARIDARLQKLVQEGFLVDGVARPRLRPGELPAVIATARKQANEPNLDRGGADGGDFQLAALDTSERALCAALAAAGTSLPIASAVRLSGLDESDAARAVAQLLGRGLLRRNARDSHVRFTGDESDLALDEREWGEIHGRIARERRDSGESPQAWLAHAWRAARSGTPEEARAADAEIVTAVEAARERGAPDAALDLLDRVAAEARACGLAPSADLVVEHAVTWVAAGGLDRALELVAGFANDPAPLVRAGHERVRGLVAFQRGEWDEAIAALERASALDPAREPELTLVRARVLVEARRDDELNELVERTSSRPDVPERLVANLRTLLAMRMARSGEVERAAKLLGELMQGARTSADLPREAALALNLGTIERRRGDLGPAIVAFERALELHERTAFLPGTAQAQAMLGGTLREAGRLVEAGPLLESAVLLRERLGDRAGAAAARGMLGLVAAERGHLRSALTDLLRAAGELARLSRSTDAALLEARAEEVRARLGEPASSSERARQKALASTALDADPRALAARARAAWMRGDPALALELAQRARDLARSLKQLLVLREAEFMVRALGGEARPGDAPDPLAEAGDDERVLAALANGASEPALRALAEDLERRGRDDRAARCRFALAARANDPRAGRGDLDAARALIATCAAGLSSTESKALQRHLLSMPDPFPADFDALEKRAPQDEDMSMDVLELFEINRRLVAQQALPDLLGAIVDSALSVTGAERGFVVLEEQGDLAIQTALDSRRGDIAEPEVEVSKSIVRQALLEGSVVRLSNAVDDPDVGGAPSVTALDLRSILCAPFDVVEGVRGVVYVDHRLRRGAFDERAERLLGLLAGQAALAIRQVRRLDEIRRLNRELARDVVHKETDLRAARSALRAAQIVPPASGLVGESAVMRKVHALLARAGPSRMAVLVTGASGTGKELAARALHELSERSSGPFVPENCAALPATLIEAELFGHKKGAYTGADADRAGLFERASGGTLFLDEIGDLPVGLQAKLLRVLETGEVRRLGDSVTRMTDVRLVTATNRDLAAEVRAGRFRADLLYRLDALRVEMPTLADRVEDIPLLVDHFLRLEVSKGGAARKIAPAVVAALCSRAWPGNVRELANEVARLCVLSPGDVVDPSLIRVPAATTSGPAQVGPRTLAQIEREAIETAIAAAGGDKAKAADVLGISRAKVYQRVKEWRDEDSAAAGVGVTSS